MFEQLDELFGFRAYEPVVGKQIFDELNKLKNKGELKIRERESASVSLKLLKNKGVKFKLIDFNSPSVDTGIAFYTAKNGQIIVATLDRELKKRILKENKKVKFLTIRQKKRIMLTN